MTGREFLSRLSPLHASRVVFMTGGAHTDSDRAFLSEQRTIAKPFERKKLKAFLEEAARETV
jgi:hypothetical protein